MDRGAKDKSQGAVGLVGVDLIDRILGGGRRRRSRRKLGSSSLCGFQGYDRLQDRSNCHEARTGTGSVELPPIEEERCESADEDGDEYEQSERMLLHKQGPRSSFSSDDSSKRWTSSTDHFTHRRRKGFSCMRLRIVNMVRIVNMMRTVRLAYRRMMNAAAASKTILSLADIYNDIADLIPVPCRGNNDEARTIVVIRPIKCDSGPSDDDNAEDPPTATTSAHSSGAKSSTSPSSARQQQDARRDPVSKSRPVEAPEADYAPPSSSSSWRKFAFLSLSCVCASNMNSWTAIESS